LITKSEIKNGIKFYIEELKNKEGLNRGIIQFEKDVLNELTPIRSNMNAERVEPAKTVTFNQIVENPIIISTANFDRLSYTSDDQQFFQK